MMHREPLLFDFDEDGYPEMINLVLEPFSRSKEPKIGSECLYTGFKIKEKIRTKNLRKEENWLQ